MIEPVNLDGAWALLLQLARRARDGRPVAHAGGVRLDEAGALHEGDGGAWIKVDPSAPRGWAWPSQRGDAALETLFDLYMPLCVGDGAKHVVVGHLAQSLDGRIATVSGASQFITGDENLLHAHRMRALCDAVLVGAKTVRADNPQLTTRLCTGDNPVRVIVAPDRRLGKEHKVFQDGAAPTLLVCTPEAAAGATHHGKAEIITVEARERQLPVAAVVATLARRGLKRLFVEGGGVTVSRFLQARALTRLHLAVAPMLLGSGRPAVSLPVIDDLSQALLLDARHFPSGRDVLFDCVLK
jgi:riboflavin-specific deaminase-like protein